MDGTILVPIIVAGVIVALLLSAMVYSRYYKKAPPDMAIIVSGRGSTFRIIRGGGGFIRPVVERADEYSIAPFELDIKLDGAYSEQSIQVDVSATALVRFGSSEEAIRTSAERFLSTDRETLQESIRTILTGHLRAVVAKMTVQALNSNREELASSVTENAGQDLAKIGLELDVLTITTITDRSKVLENTGRVKAAEVKRDAEIAEADADRDSRIQRAEAEQDASVAEAAADAVKAEADRDRDVRKAKARAESDRENETAAQAGPLAKAEAERAVKTAEAARDAEAERAGIEVEQEKVRRQEKAQEAEHVVPAKAKADAAKAEAEGKKAAAILVAEGEKEKREKEGQGDAEARKALAAATEAELKAEASGIEAKLTAEAKGRRELAEALNAYGENAVALVIYPDMIEKLPEMVSAAASSFEKVERIVMVDTGGGNGQGPAGKMFGQTVGFVAGGLEIAKEMGLDIPGLLGGRGASTNGSGDVSEDEDSKKRASAKVIPSASEDVAETKPLESASGNEEAEDAPREDEDQY